jgi:hypothetical protein
MVASESLTWIQSVASKTLGNFLEGEIVLAPYASGGVAGGEQTAQTYDKACYQRLCC